MSVLFLYSKDYNKYIRGYRSTSEMKMRTKRKGKAVDRESMTIVVGLTVSMEWHFHVEMVAKACGKRTIVP